MIKVTSANDDSVFYINHRKIKFIKHVNNILHIALDDGHCCLVKDSIDDIKKEIIEFESNISSIMHIS